MKTIIYLLFVLLALTAKFVKTDASDPFDDLGFMNITTVTNDDPNSCLVTLSLQLFADHIQFFSTIISNPVPDCTHHDLQFVSFFHGDNLNSSIVLAPTADPNVNSGSLTLATIQAMNGTGCLYEGHIITDMAYHTCQFRFNDLIFDVQIYIIPSNGQINTSFYDLFNPIIGSSNVSANGITVWNRPDWSFPSYFGQIGNVCGGWSNTITSMSNELVITGMDLKQYLTNLSYFNNFTASPMWIRQKGTANYIWYYVPNPYWYPFNGSTVNYCTDTGRKFSDILPNATYCQNGCDVTFGLVGSNLPYNLQTNGFTTVPSRALRTEDPQN